MCASAQGVVEVGYMTTASFCGAICGIEPRSDAAGLTIADGAYCFYCRMWLGVTVIDGNCRPISRFSPLSYTDLAVEAKRLVLRQFFVS